MKRLAVVVLLALGLLAACSGGFDPDPCDNVDGTCSTVPSCGEAGTCDGG